MSCQPFSTANPNIVLRVAEIQLPPLHQQIVEQVALAQGPAPKRTAPARKSKPGV